jgi:DnaJ-class molecular chaperone
LIHDGLYGESRQITLKRATRCAVCGGTGGAAAVG